MKKTNKKNSTMRKLLPAFAMLTVSAISLTSATYAWFTMNKSVTVNGMQLKAKAETGLVVSNATDGTYDETAATTKNAVAQLYPGSTYDLSTWLHSTSGKTDAANTQKAYTAGTAWTSNTDCGNYVVHDFYLKGATADATPLTSLDINKVEAKVSSSAPSQELSKALRVGIKFDGSSNIYIYAPVTGYTATVSVQKVAGAYSSTAADRESVSALAGSVKSTDTAITSLPARTTDSPIHASVYIWYEGEDANCKSDNLLAAASVEQIEVSVEFGITES